MKNEEILTFQGFGAIISHGETLPDTANNYDPPLSIQGLNQAKSMASNLKTFFTQQNMSFDKIII